MLAFPLIAVAILLCYSAWNPPVQSAPPSRNGPMRFAQIRHAFDISQTREPLTIALDRGWQCGGATGLAYGSEGLSLTPGDEAAVLTRVVDIDAGRYNAVRVRMKVEGGNTCRFSWSGAKEPKPEGNPGVSAVLFADGEFHTYAFSLAPPQAAHWQGQIDCIALQPSDKAVQAHVASFELLCEPPQAPARVTICEETLEAMGGSDLSWELTVPSNAVLEVHLGLLERSWQELHTDGARFVVELRQPGQDPVTLVDRSLTPTTVESHRPWQLEQTDLSAHVGKDVALAFRVTPLKSALGTYAFWGNPEVFTQCQEPAKVPVFLISCDTLRADRVSCYGYERPATPNLDAFAKECVLFENAIVQEAWTPTSHMTMLTGLYPKRHGLTATLNISEQIVTLAEALREAGYMTAGYVGHRWWLLPERGFAQGFDIYSTPRSYRDVFEIHGLSGAWLDRHRCSNVFLFLHNYDIHSKKGFMLPYDSEDDRFRVFSKTIANPPVFEPIERRELGASLFLAAANRKECSITPEQEAYMSALYDDCVLKVDHAIGEFLEDLKARGLYENALIIITSDHGEAFGEHDAYMHADVYEHNIRVPLFVKFPGGRFAGRRVAEMVQLVDLYPTVLDVLGLDLPGTVDGGSLLALLEGRREPIPAAYSQRAAWQTVRTPRMKILRETQRNTCELYDLIEDPKETSDIYAGSAAIRGTLVRALDEFFSTEPGGWHIALRTQGAQWPLEVRIETNDRFELTKLLRGKMLEHGDRKGTSRRVEGAIILNEAFPEDTLIVRAASPDAHVRLTIHSELPFVVLCGGQSDTSDGAFSLILDPESAQVRAPPNGPNGDAPRSIRIWYEPPPALGTPASKLTEEALDELKALGYVD